MGRRAGTLTRGTGTASRLYHSSSSRQSARGGGRGPIRQMSQRSFVASGRWSGTAWEGPSGQQRTLGSWAGWADGWAEWAAEAAWLGPRAEQAVRYFVVAAVTINVLGFPFVFAFHGPVGEGIEGSPPIWYELLLWCDAVLWCDVGLRFVTPVQPLEGEGGKLLSHRRVALRYPDP